MIFMLKTPFLRINFCPSCPLASPGSSRSGWIPAAAGMLSAYTADMAEKKLCHYYNQFSGFLIQKLLKISRFLFRLISFQALWILFSAFTFLHLHFSILSAESSFSVIVETEDVFLSSPFIINAKINDLFHCCRRSGRQEDYLYEDHKREGIHRTQFHRRRY